MKSHASQVMCSVACGHPDDVNRLAIGETFCSATITSV